MVAPGGGTQADVNNVANTLGLQANSVAAILSCEGSGVASVRSSRSSGVDNDTAKPVNSSAWADFMADDGNDKSDHANDKGEKDESAAKRAKTDTPAVSSSSVKEYDLPILTRMRPPSEKNAAAKKFVSPGVLAMTGSLDAKMVGRTKRPLKETFDLQEPTVLGFDSVFNGKHVGIVATSAVACHSIAITTDGTPYSWGRNESGQCGFHPSACVPFPKQIELSGKFVGAALGKSHSILIEESGACYAVGLNKYGQCGVNTSNESIASWRKCVLSNASDAKIVQASCGENFTVLLDSDGIMYSAGLGEFGQLGNGETGEYFIAANKIGFANSTKFERRSVFVHKPPRVGMEDAKKSATPLADSDNIRIGSISCGKNHTIAVEAAFKDESHGPQRVFSWGCGAYGVLGHGVQEDQYTPQMINVFVSPIFQNNSPVRVAAGASCSLILTKNGHVYYSGKHRSVGEATMRPAVVDVLANNAHVVTALDGGAQTVFCSTQNGVTVSWGNGQTGELGYGANNPKSSSKPKFVEKLDKVLITDTACGYGHTLFIIRDEDAEDKNLLKTIAKIEASDLEDFIKKWSS